MKLVITHSYLESAALCARMMEEAVCNNPEGLIGLATGSTPIPVYEKMVQGKKEGKADYSNIHTINLDEYIGVPKENVNSYMYFMRKHLLDEAGVKKDNIYIPDGMAQPQAETARLNGYLNHHVMDIQLLSVGTNGHIGFNEPSDVFFDQYHIVTLTEETRQSNSRLFNRIEEVPKMAITMGIGGIMRAKKIAFLATGNEKLFAMKGILEEGDIIPKNQGTILKLHADCTIFLDKELANQITPADGVEVVCC